MNGLNTMIEELHSNLINDINSSHLPVSIVYYVVKDVFNEVELSYRNVLTSEKEKPTEEIKTEEITNEE